MLETIVVLVVVSENIINLSEIKDKRAFINYRDCLDLDETITGRNIDRQWTRFFITL